MNNKEFTDKLFRIMYDLGYRKAEVIKEGVFFYKDNTLMSTWTPRVPTKCTCFEDKYQCIDIAGYLGIIDWSKVKVDTPILVSFDGCNWFKKYFAKVQNDTVYAFDDGATSWSVINKEYCVTRWKYAKLAEV